MSGKWNDLYSLRTFALSRLKTPLEWQLRVRSKIRNSNCAIAYKNTFEDTGNDGGWVGRAESKGEREERRRRRKRRKGRWWPKGNWQKRRIDTGDNDDNGDDDDDHGNDDIGNDSDNDDNNDNDNDNDSDNDRSISLLSKELGSSSTVGNPLRGQRFPLPH